MKLCWDNIENIRLSRNGNFFNIIRKRTYHLKACKECGEEFLGRNDAKFCSISCTSKGKNHPMYSKKHSKSVKKKISASLKGKNHPNYGKYLSEATKTRISKANKGRVHTEESRANMSKGQRGRTGKKSSNWKGGYASKGVPMYDTYAPQLNWCEKVRRSPDDENVLEVKCFKCGDWFVPSSVNVKNRIQVLKSNDVYRGEQHFYCSEQCKRACSIYHKSPGSLMKEDAVRAGRLQWLELDREVQPELRKMVLARDEYTCQKCGTQDKPLHCHHILPVATNPIESADVDNCITLCYNCHKEVHDQDGCRYSDLKGEYLCL